MTMQLAIGMFDYDLPLDEGIARMRRLGVRRVELVCPKNVVIADAETVRKHLAEAGLETSAVATLTKPNAVDDPEEVAMTLDLLQESIRVAAILGASRAITYFGGHPTRSHNEAVERYVELVGPSLEVAAEHGVDVLIENHFSHAPGEVTNTPGGCRELIEAVGHPNFALNFDPCNFAVGGEDQVEAYDRLKDLVRNVHMKDTLPFNPDEHSDYPGRIVTDLHRGDFIFAPMGTGITDNQTVLKRLNADGYDGPVSVEAHTPQDTLDEVFAIGRDYCLANGVER